MKLGTFIINLWTVVSHFVIDIQQDGSSKFGICVQAGLQNSVEQRRNLLFLFPLSTFSVFINNICNEF